MVPSYLLCLLTFLSQYEHYSFVDGFTFQISSSSSLSPERRSQTLRHLKPQQGSELVEASENLYGPHDDDDEDSKDHVSKRPPTHPVVEKQRSFVRRAFSLPSYLWHPHAKVEGVRIYKNDIDKQSVKIDAKRHENNNDFVEENFHDIHELSKHEDVVYFPIIGFTFVKDAPGHSRPLPGLTNPSCRLHDDNEVYFGSFHPDPTRTEPHGEKNDDLPTPKP